MKNIKLGSCIQGIVFFLILLMANNQNLYAQISWHKHCGSEYRISEETTPPPKLAAVPDTMIIPVVFHILTQGGVENISKEQVFHALQILNDDFNNKNPDTLDIPSPFRNVRGNPKIEFRLARIDPQGNCTDGIDRIYTPYTYGPGGTGNHFNLQKLFDWNHKKYINIYVVNWIEIPNDFTTLGIAYIPPVSSVANHPEFNDALTICYNGLGAGFNGFSVTYGGRALTHEMGHFTGLLHPWGEGDIGNNCMDDDHISDTPIQSGPNYYCPTFPQISCENEANGDMFNNYMDYTDCKNLFSRGQVERMRSVFSVHPWRKEQWTEENILLTGVKMDLPVCEMPPVADFGYGNAANHLVVGSLIRFNEACSWEYDSLYWEFEKGIPASSAEKFPQVIFQDTGFHQVSLYVKNAFGSNTITKNVFVSPRETNYDQLMTETFEEDTDELLRYNIKGTPWILTDKAAKSGSKSFYNPGNDQYLSGFFTHIFKLGNSPTPGRQLTFNVALGMASSGNAEAGLRLLWKRPADFDRAELEAWSGTAITAKPLHDGDVINPELLRTFTTNVSFIPNADQWKTMTLPIPDTLTGEIQIGFLWANFIPTTKFKGLYIDNIRITGTTDVKVTETSGSFLVFPNPASDHFTMQTSLDLNHADALMTVYDLYGRLVMSKKGSEIRESQDVSTLTNGIYIIELKSMGRAFRSKLLIAK